MLREARCAPALDAHLLMLITAKQAFGRAASAEIARRRRAEAAMSTPERDIYSEMAKALLIIREASKEGNNAE